MRSFFLSNSKYMLYSNYWFLVLLKGSLITCIKSNLKITNGSKHEVKHLISFPQIFKSPICQVTGFIDIFWCSTPSAKCAFKVIFLFLKELIVSISLVNNLEKEKAYFQPPLFLLSYYFFIFVCLSCPSASQSQSSLLLERSFPPLSHPSWWIAWQLALQMPFHTLLLELILNRSYQDYYNIKKLKNKFYIAYFIDFYWGISV